MKPHSDHIITRPHYHGSFYITDIIKNEGFGPSYRLVRTSDGRPLRNLISGSRLRQYTAPQRADFHVKYPKLSVTCQSRTKALSEPPANSDSSVKDRPTEPTTNIQANNQPTQQNNEVTQPSVSSMPYESAIRILRERKKSGKPEYFVLFETKEKAWADRVSPALLRDFRIRQEQARNKRRKRRKRS